MSKLLLLYKPSEEHLIHLQAVAPSWQIVHTIEYTNAKTEIVEAAIVMGNHNLTEILPYATQVQWVQTASSGVDYILSKCKHILANIIFTHCGGVYTNEIAEHAVALVFALSRNLHTLVVNQQQSVWQRLAGLTTIKDSNVTILGKGNLGTAIQQKLYALGANVKTVTDFGLLNELLPRTDVLVCALPYTENCIIDSKELKLLPPNAKIINIGRPSTINQEELIMLLETNPSMSAAIDVFMVEPLPKDNKAWKLPNLIVSPHTARSIEEPPHAYEGLFLENFTRFIKCEPLLNLVNIQKGY